MFGLGFWEFIILALAVIVFVKPSELPKVFYKIGRIYGQLQEFNRGMRRTMRQFERQIAESDTESGAKTRTKAGEPAGSTASGSDGSSQADSDSEPGDAGKADSAETGGDSTDPPKRE